tara:strand:+ start:1955 stop:2134 length:180 start_codon:yes stop_codon:yes gene_type:complete
MKIALSLDEELNVVTLEFECDHASDAQVLFDALTRQTESGQIEIHLRGSGAPLTVSRPH